MSLTLRQRGKVTLIGMWSERRGELYEKFIHWFYFRFSGL
jgi:hypothetical protein